MFFLKSHEHTELLVHGARYQLLWWASLSPALSSCVCWSTFNLSRHFLLLPSEHCLPKLSSLSSPNRCNFLHVWSGAGDHYREGVRADFLPTSQKRAQDPLSRELSARSQERRDDAAAHLIRRRVSEKGEKKCDSMLLEKQRGLPETKCHYKFCNSCHTYSVAVNVLGSAGQAENLRILSRYL